MAGDCMLNKSYPARQQTSQVCVCAYISLTFLNKNTNKSDKWHCGRHTTIKKT